MYVMRLPSIFGTEDWLTVPYLHRHKDLLDQIIDKIIASTGLMHSIDQLKTFHSHFEAAEERQRIQTQAETIKAELDTLWDQVRTGAGLYGGEEDRFDGLSGFDWAADKAPSKSTPTEPESVSPIPSSNASAPDPSKPSIDNPHILPPMAPKGPASRTVVFYSTARILLLSLLSQLSCGKSSSPDTSPDPDPDTRSARQIQAHCSSVLAVASWMTASRVGYAYLRIIFPLHVVGTESPCEEQRKEARRILTVWGRYQGVGVGGVCEVAVRCLDGVGWGEGDVAGTGRQEEEEGE